MDIEYNVILETGTRPITIDWGNEPGWAERYRAELEGAGRIGLVPKRAGGKLPPVFAALGEGRRWVIFSQVVGRVNGPGQVRLYAIGWQATIGGRNVKALVWVYPDGHLSLGETPEPLIALLRGQ